MNGNMFQPALGFLSGVLIGLSIITPVFSATSPGMEQWNGLLTLLAALLLVLGFVLYATRAARDRRVVSSHRNSPDL